MYKDNMLTFKSDHSFSDMLPKNSVSFGLSDDGESLRIEMVSYSTIGGKIRDMNFVILNKNEENHALFDAISAMIEV